MSTPASEAARTAETSQSISVPDIDVGSSEVRYVNFCRVTGTPEEMIIDLGLQTPEGASKQEWEAPQRIALDFYTAKRLVHALQSTLTQFETTFGKIEVEVERRLIVPK